MRAIETYSNFKIRKEKIKELIHFTSIDNILSVRRTFICPRVAAYIKQDFLLTITHIKK